MIKLWTKYKTIVDLFKVNINNPLPLLGLTRGGFWRAFRRLFLLAGPAILWYHKSIFELLVKTLYKIQLLISYVLTNITNAEVLLLFFIFSVMFFMLFSKIRLIVGYGPLIQTWLYMFFVGCFFFLTYYQTTQIS